MLSTSKRNYSYTFLLPAAVIYGVIFLIPTIMSLFFSFTRWTLFDWEFIGLDNFVTFFNEPSLAIGLKNSLIFASLRCASRVIFGLLLAVFLCQGLKIKNYLQTVIFFPTLLSTIAVGITFSSLMHPTRGVINQGLAQMGIAGPDWLGNVNYALYSVILVDFWKEIGGSVLIYVAGIMSIPTQYYEALSIDGGNRWQKFRYVTLPLVRPAMNSVIILSLIGGLRSFDLVWVMTKGGPGFATDLMASVIYKQYSSGFYGLSTAGNVVMFLVVSIVAFPLYTFLTRKEDYL